MTFYRLFRYFTFLFCAGSVFLYVCRDSFSPFPAFSQAFQKFDAYYQGLDKAYNTKADAEKAENILRAEAERLIQPEKNALARFLADEETKVSLNIFDKGFNSLEALVRIYFIADETFKDLIITRQGAILYRYENVPVNQDFGVTENVPTESGILTIRVLHSPESFLGRVGYSKYPIVLKWKNNNTYSQSLESRTFDKNILKNEITPLSPSFEMVQQNDREILYSYKPAAPYVQAPVFYFIEKLPDPQWVSHKALFIVAFLTGLLLVLMLDRQIIKYFRTKSQKKVRKNLFPAFGREGQSEDSMEWLDKLAANEFSEYNKTQAEEDKASPKEGINLKVDRKLSPPPNRKKSHDF